LLGLSEVFDGKVDRETVRGDDSTLFNPADLKNCQYRSDRAIWGRKGIIDLPSILVSGRESIEAVLGSV